MPDVEGAAVDKGDGEIGVVAPPQPTAPTTNAARALRQTTRNAAEAFRQTSRNAAEAFRQTLRRSMGHLPGRAVITPAGKCSHRADRFFPMKTQAMASPDGS